MRRIAFQILALLIVIALALGGAIAWGYGQFGRPGPSDVSVTLVIPKGAGLVDIATRLEKAGIIAQPIVFEWAARLTGADKRLQAGEYAFPPMISIQNAIALLESGKTVVRRLTLVEGLTVAQAIEALAAVDGLTGTMPSLPDEGTLLPETYHFSYGDSRREIVERMTRAMSAAVAQLWAERAADLPFDSPRDAVILASIVEKETGLPDERAHIAAVFINRLRKGMRLQSDPTVVYALTDGKGALGRPLTRADLKVVSPFNTYLETGLPPQPICNPGRASVAAVLNPAASDDLYFVAEGNGGHLFARTLAEHNRNVAHWRKIRDQEALPPAETP